MHSADYLNFWGKARPASGDAIAWHPLAYHMLDVAAVVESLLTRRATTGAKAGYLLGLSQGDACRVLVSLAALHDIGKFAPAFQRLASPSAWSLPVSLEGTDRTAFERSIHTADGMMLWEKNLQSQLANRIWSGGDSAVADLACAIFGHHGRPVDAGTGPIGSRFSLGAVAAASDYADRMLRCLGPLPVCVSAPRVRDLHIASWWVAGLMTVGDWIGSRRAWFPYTLPIPDDDDLSRYWSLARNRAANAVERAGLAGTTPAPRGSFESLTGKATPTPMQEWALSVVLPDEPILAIIEDATGSGKTEAAHVLVHRLMAYGRASGAYWAMPTQATANAMYGRQRDAISALFAPRNGEKPSLTLGHGQARLHESYRATVIVEESDDTDVRELGDTAASDESAAVACAAFLADDRRAALLADVGVGTIDQALLSVLPTKFNAVRLFALAEKVLVLDEVHAFDAYMSQEISHLLRFQAALGGSAVLLSATLSESRRRELEQLWRTQRFGSVEVHSGHAQSQYPLATLVRNGELEPVVASPAPAQGTVRSVPVRVIHSEDLALEHLIAASRQSGCGVWVRNTVDECLRAASLLDSAGVTPIVFHARFAQSDRQRIESEVLSTFGSTSTATQRAGAILLATQVVEQSLDLDFDAMVSDLAPIDLLIQRAGRLWRHSREHRPEISRELVVLAPDRAGEVPATWPDPLLRNTRFVYPDAGVLWRTLRVLHDEAVIDAPRNVRELIRRVYEAEGELPAALQRAENEAIGAERAGAGIADYNVLPLEGGYRPERAWSDDLRPQTRLGEEQVPIRLAKVEGGSLKPWCEDDGMPEWKRWLLSEVKVSAKRVPWDARAPELWRDAVDDLREGWPRFEQRVPVLVLERDPDDCFCGTVSGRRGGNFVKLSYSPLTGLRYS